jgi:hypothetical protein
MSEKRPSGSSASKRALKVYLLFFLMGGGGHYFLSTMDQNIFCIYNVKVDGKIWFALWKFTIWTHFKEYIPSVIKGHVILIA